MSIAFSGVGVGSIVLLPWLQAPDRERGLARGLLALGLLVLVVLAPLNLLLRQRPEDIGLQPDGDAAPRRDGAGASRRTWSIRRGPRSTGRWAAPCGPRASGGSRSAIFCGLFAWYAVQVHQTKYLVEVGFSPTHAAWALGLVSLAGIPGQIALGHLSDRIGREWVWTRRLPGLRALLRRCSLLRSYPTAGAALRHGRRAGHARLRPDLGLRRDPRRDLPGSALRQHLRHADAGRDRRRRARALGDRRAPRRHRQLRPRPSGSRSAASALSALAIWLAAPRHVRAVAGRIPLSVRLFRSDGASLAWGLAPEAGPRGGLRHPFDSDRTSSKCEEYEGVPLRPPRRARLRRHRREGRAVAPKEAAAVSGHLWSEGAQAVVRPPIGFPASRAPRRFGASGSWSQRWWKSQLFGKRSLSARERGRRWRGRSGGGERRRADSAA